MTHQAAAPRRLLSRNGAWSHQAGSIGICGSAFSRSLVCRFGCPPFASLERRDCEMPVRTARAICAPRVSKAFLSAWEALEGLVSFICRGASMPTSNDASTKKRLRCESSE